MNPTSPLISPGCPTSSALVWFDGSLTDSPCSMLSVNDRGVSHGLGLFETLLAMQGRPVFWGAHLRRLRNSLERLGWQEIHLPDEQDAIRLIASSSCLSDTVRLRIGVSGGDGEMSAPSHGNNRRVWMVVSPLPSSLSPLRVMLSPWRRNENSPLTGLKSASYAENLLALEYAARHDCNELLWLNGREELCEASTANVFLVRGDTLQTPPLSSGCLPGITREWVLSQAPDLGFVCREEPLTLTDLALADEVFLTSATRGPKAVSCLQTRNFPKLTVSQLFHAHWCQAVRTVSVGSSSISDPSMSPTQGWRENSSEHGIQAEN